MTSHTPSWRAARRTALRPAVAAVLAGGLLAGCAQTPDTAAVVDGRAISQATVDEAVAELDRLAPGQLDAGAVLVSLAAAPYFIEAAAESGVAASTEDARELAGQLAAQGGTTADLGPAALELLQFSVASRNIQELPDGAAVLEEVRAELAAADVETNPRLGSLDLSTGQLLPLQVPWITTPQQ